MAANVFGWDLLFKSVESEIKRDEDVLLCFTHLVLINNGFKCIDLGESKTFDGTEPKSEVLPKGWSDVCAIRYNFQGRLYNLKCTKLDDGVMINLIRIDERTTSLVQLNSSSVAARSGSLEDMLPKYEEMAKLVKTQLIDKIVVSKKSREVSSQTATTSSERQQRGSSSTSQQTPPLVYDPLRIIPPNRPVGVGELDRDPFLGPYLGRGRGRGRGIFPERFDPAGGGGMLFEPPRIPQPYGPNFGLPPGAIPPGARFDPFRPPDVGNNPRRRLPPDHDEMPPPGYDDMFM